MSNLIKNCLQKEIEQDAQHPLNNFFMATKKNCWASKELHFEKSKKVL